MLDLGRIILRNGNQFLYVDNVVYISKRNKWLFVSTASTDQAALEVIAGINPRGWEEVNT